MTDEPTDQNVFPLHADWEAIPEEIDWDADEETIREQVYAHSSIHDMDEVMAQLIEAVRLLSLWAADHPDHKQVGQWAQELLVAALYVANEYSYKADEHMQLLQQLLDQQS